MGAFCLPAFLPACLSACLLALLALLACFASAVTAIAGALSVGRADLELPNRVVPLLNPDKPTSAETTSTPTPFYTLLKKRHEDDLIHLPSSLVSQRTYPLYFCAYLFAGHGFHNTSFYAAKIASGLS